MATRVRTFEVYMSLHVALCLPLPIQSIRMANKNAEIAAMQ